ncbi:hypothetical protein FORC17_2737 [Vibrio vulnificus]|nr:hypothetical protein FORC17_2737 [Vibrio vulnificus]
MRELIRAPNCHSRACGDLFIHTCQKPRLEMHSPRQTTTKAKPTATPTMKCEKRATALAIRWVPAFARMTKIRNEKAELSSAAKNKKLSTPPPRHQLSFPCIRGSIHPHVPEAAFGNAFTATDNNESEATNNTGNEALKPSHGARYTMGPRVCEDDGVREWIRTTSNTNNKALKPSYSARYTMGPRVREDDLVIESMVNLLSLTHATANAKDNSCANNDGNIEASLDDCLISPFLITPSIVPLNTIFY